MEASVKLIQTKRKYNPDDKRNKRIAQGSRTSRRQGTKSRHRNRQQRKPSR
jgi:hypothetical protein